MDDSLARRLDLWMEQIECLHKLELQHFQIEGSEKSLFASLYLLSDAKTVAEKEQRAYASSDWKEFQTGLAVSKATLNHERRKLDLLQRAYEAEYLSLKRSP